MEKIPSFEKNPFLDDNGVEQAFSKEGLLNRNFGKDSTIPSEAAVYRNGILNRAKINRDNKNIPSDDAEQAVSGNGTEKERSFEKAEKEAASEEEKETVTLPNPEKKPESTRENKGENEPLLASFVKAYENLSDDPVGAALRAVYDRLESQLSDEEKSEKMQALRKEYEAWQKKQ